MGKNKERTKQGLERTISYILMVFLFLIGITIGILFKVFFPSDSTVSYKQTREGGYEFINPLVDFESIESAKIGDFMVLERDLNSYVDREIEDPQLSKVSHISLYYKDLNSGGWIGIREEEGFSPASLLKLPIMIAAYKVAETDSELLKKEIVFRKENPVAIQSIVPEEHLEDGKIYTVNELIERLIKYSDNDALAPIEDLVSYKNLADVYEDLGIRDPALPENEDTMTVKEYASFFRILYNASYLNKDMSTKALKLLSETNYDAGLVSGIPKDIKIANKFGERIYNDAPKDEQKQLHDCGIVYHPTKPYLVCIMTKGSDMSKLQNVIKDLSSIIYTYANKK